MNVPVILALMLTAAPAAAMDVNDMPTWSAEAHVVKGQTSHDTVLVFTRTGPGAWRVRAECQTTDVRSRKWKSHKAVGEARLHQGFVVGEIGQLGRMVVAADRLSIEDARCASGPVTMGTGD
jgi:hypothetical protein